MIYITSKEYKQLRGAFNYLLKFIYSILCCLFEKILQIKACSSYSMQCYFFLLPSQNKIKQFSLEMNLVTFALSMEQEKNRITFDHCKCYSFNCRCHLYFSESLAQESGKMGKTVYVMDVF